MVPHMWIWLQCMVTNQGVTQISTLIEMIQIGSFREEEKPSTWQGIQGADAPDTPWSEAVNLSTQKGSERGCKTLEKETDTGAWYNDFGCVVILETFSIVIFFGLLVGFLFSFLIKIRSGLMRIHWLDHLDFDYANNRFLALHIKCFLFVHNKILSLTHSTNPRCFGDWGNFLFFCLLTAMHTRHLKALTFSPLSQSNVSKSWNESLSSRRASFTATRLEQKLHWGST